MSNFNDDIGDIGEKTDVNRLDFIPTRLTQLPDKMPRNVTYRKRKSLPPEYRPGDFDVCCGRGKRHWNHVGNVRFRRIIQTNVERYMDAPLKNDKTAVVVSIVDDIRNLGGHFLKEDLRGKWYDIGDQQAREKVGHSLRDQVSTIHRQKRKEAALQLFTNQQEAAAAANQMDITNTTMNNNNNNNQQDNAADFEPLPLGPMGSNDMIMSQQPLQQQMPQQQHQQPPQQHHQQRPPTHFSSSFTQQPHHQSFSQQQHFQPAPMMVSLPEEEEDEDAHSDHGENEDEMMRTLKSSLIIERFARRPSITSSISNPHNSLSSSNSRSVHDSRTSRMSSARSSGWSFLQNLDLDLDQFEDYDGAFEPIAYKSES